MYFNDNAYLYNNIIIYFVNYLFLSLNIIMYSRLISLKGSGWQAPFGGSWREILADGGKYWWIARNTSGWRNLLVNSWRLGSDPNPRNTRIYFSISHLVTTWASSAETSLPGMIPTPSLINFSTSASEYLLPMFPTGGPAAPSKFAPWQARQLNL